MRIAIAGGAVLLLVAALGLAGGRAGAHGVQIRSTPAPNAQLSQPPAEISITFSEPVEPSVTTVHLWDQTATEIELPAPQFPAPDQVVVGVPEELGPGIYTVIWRNLSTVDGHTWAGSFPFIVLGPGGEVPEGAVPQAVLDLGGTPSGNPSTLESAARWVVLLGGAVLLGGSAYVFFVAYPATRRLSPDAGDALRNLSRTVLLVTGGIAVFLVLEGSLLQLVVQADRLGGLGRVNDLLVDTRFGRYLIARQVLLLLALLSIGLIWRGGTGALGRIGVALLLAASFGVLITQSLVSHAASGDGTFWKIGADALHLLTASLWIGGLVHVGLSMPRWLDEIQGATRTIFAAESFRRFSVLAAVSVLVLMVSGVLSALAQFTSFDELWSTKYGWSLAGKLAAMLPLLGVAALNAFILQPRIVDAARQVAGAAIDDAARTGAVAGLQRLMARTVRLEAVLAILVLAAVAVLIQLEPPRAIAEAEAAIAASADPPPAQDERGYYLRAAQSGGLVVSLRIEPGTVGQNEFEVGLGSEFGEVGDVLDVRLDFEHQDALGGGSRLDLQLAGSLKYVAEASNLSLPGDWTVTVTVRRRGQDEDVRAPFDVPVAAAPRDAPDADPEAAPVEASGSMWDWPFEGARSTGAIAALALGGVGALATGAWQLRRLRA